MLKNKKLIIALLLIPQIIIVKVLPYFPEFVERFYSNGLYKFTSKSLRYVFGWLPFSFGDLFYGLLIFFALRWLILNRKRTLKDTKSWLIDVGATISLVYFAFHIFWGFNYYRLPIHNKLDLENDYTTETLLEVTKQLITKTNTLQSRLTGSDSLKVEFPYSKKELLEKIPLGYRCLVYHLPIRVLAAT